MATTSKALAASKVVAGPGNNGKGSKGRSAGLLATAALGLSLAVGGLLGQARQAAPAAESPQANPFAGDTHVATMWDFREDRRAELAPAFVADQFTFREDRRVAAADTFAANQFTYREDRRAELVPVFVPDQFTYREDRRAGSAPIQTPTDFGPREYLPGEESTPGNAPSPAFGPQP